HTVWDPTPHHVVDSWERAETDVRSSFLGGPATMSISNYTLANTGYYQGVFNDGNATMVQLKPPPTQYPVVFDENGLGNQTSWSVTLNGTTQTSQRPDIVFEEPNGTYLFIVGTSPGFNVSPSQGTLKIDGRGASQSIRFRTPWTNVWNKMIRCGQHAFTFDLETGEGLNCAGYRIERYAVTENDGNIFVCINGDEHSDA